MAHEVRDANNSVLFFSSTGTGADAGNAIVVDVAVGNFPATQPVSLATLPTITVDSGSIAVTSLPSLPTGDNNIGNVDVLTLPPLPAGGNAIGSVSVSALPTPTLLSATGTIATSGDNTVIDISAVAGYSAGDNIVITHFILQNESSTATTAIVKDGATTIARVLGQNQGDGLALNFASGLEWRLSDDADLVVNLSGANSFGYTVFYYLES